MDVLTTNALKGALLAADIAHRSEVVIPVDDLRDLLDAAEDRDELETTVDELQYGKDNEINKLEEKIALFGELVEHVERVYKVAEESEKIPDDIFSLISDLLDHANEGGERCLNPKSNVICAIASRRSAATLTSL